MSESTTFTFQVTIMGQLTVHKDRLGDGTAGRRNDAARELIKDVIARVAQPGTGPLVFNEVSAGEITFRDIEDSDPARIAKGPHSFVGRRDRDCTRCGRADRHSIHVKQPR